MPSNLQTRYSNRKSGRGFGFPLFYQLIEPGDGSGDNSEISTGGVNSY